MPIAEIHKKVPAEIRTSEDTLTGGAFGLLTLLPPRHLEAWLRRARRRDGGLLELSAVQRVDASFWPELDAVDGTCEPDLLLLFTHEDATTQGLLVEVKYKSDLSGWPTPPDTDPIVRAQLGREWEALSRMAAHVFPSSPTHVDQRSLLYVTAHAVCPVETLDRVADELNAKGGNGASFLEDAYWCSWFDLAPVAEQALTDLDAPHIERVGLQRLLDLLRARRLCAFSAVAKPRSIQVAWSYRKYPIAPASMPQVSWTYHSTEGK